MTSAPEWNLPLISQTLSWVSVVGAPALPPDLAGDAGYWMPGIAGAGERGVWIPVTEEEIEHAMLTSLSAMVNLVPGVGDVKGVVEFVWGSDLISGEKLPWWERTLGLASALSTGVNARSAVTLAEAAVKTARTVETLDVLDKSYKMLNVARIDPGVLGSVLADASEALGSGADVETLDWRRETTAVIHAGLLEATRLTAQIQEKQALSPETASQVSEILVKTFVRQAQADGLLPRRLQVVASAAEGGGAGETVDVWDPMTGVAWDLTGAGSADPASALGRTMTSGGATVTISAVVPVQKP